MDTLITPQFHPQNAIFSGNATKSVISYWGGGGGESCDFQAPFKGGLLSFLPNGRGGSRLF